MTAKLIDVGVYADWNVPSSSKGFDQWLRDLEWLKSLGVSDVVIGLADTVQGPPDSILDSRERTLDVCRMTGMSWATGIAPWLMTWTHRNRSWVERILPKLLELQVESMAIGRILDCEGGIMRAGGGFQVDMTPQAFADSVVNLMGDGAWGITGLASLVTPLRALAKASDLVIPQALSVWESDAQFAARKAKSSQPDRLQPIRGDAPPLLQIESYRSWAEYAPMDIELEIGAYYQNRPGMIREECFTRQIQAAVDLGTRRVWLWSLKNMRANRWTEEIIGEYTGAIQ